MATSQTENDRLPAVRSRAQVVRPGNLPLTEFTFDRAGAASPFGDDLSFPLPQSELSYVHPDEDAAPQHL
ncbi:MAG TPA: hypothetical protein VKB69_10500 [Micromonosporaceae bacterium]|nr:hypothetical protein [Micromonosporaceae bacterium]